MRESEAFRKQYCLFWKSLFLLDKKTIMEICTLWGVGDSQMLGTPTVLFEISYTVFKIIARIM